MNTLKSVILLMVVILQSHMYAQNSTIAKDTKDEIIEIISSSLKTDYVTEEKGTYIANMLEKEQSKGTYNSITNAKMFTEILNRDLYTFSKDLHLSITLDEPLKKSQSITSQKKLAKKASFFETKKLNDFAYLIKFDRFPRLRKHIKEEIDDIMNSMDNKKSIIIDLRDNSGGSEEFVEYLMSYFFSKKTALATSYKRNALPKEVFVNPNKSMPTKFAKTSLYILVGASTFSAAEAFTFRLQQYNRAVVVGQRTPGALHRTVTYLINDQFLFQLPNERSVHTISKTDIENIGVIPDIKSHYNNSIFTAMKQVLSENINHNTTKELKKWKQKEEQSKVFINNSDRTQNVIENLESVINSSSESSFESFLNQFVATPATKKVRSSLNRFITIWGSAKIKDTQFIKEDKIIKLFLKTQYGTRQIKVVLGQDYKIKKLFYR